ncbi:hypothetical protein C8Q77DRAFT_1136768 [Trametes polyzona]|nr:hypothetical protein C8Q77DRAFT_1136768 [Trametes polyzona]
MPSPSIPTEPSITRGRVVCPDLPDGWPFSDCQIGSFWLGWKDWLATRGCALTLDVIPTSHGPMIHWRIPPASAPALLPYAHRALGKAPTGTYDSSPIASIGWAQDGARRDIALKVIARESEEYRVYQTLLNPADPRPNAQCVGVLRPLAILDTSRSFSFVVMPRWGIIPTPSYLRTVGEVMQFMRCTSQDLQLLHENRIVHRDLKISNILINYFNPASVNVVDRKRSIQDFLGSTKTEDVQYCLFDFDISGAFPHDVLVKTYRTDSEWALYGTPFLHPPDARLGEYDYNPFAFDVGCLGNFYTSLLRSVVPLVPLLAPLFDKMTTWVVDERFTACEAAQFIEDILAELPKDVLETTIDWESEYDHADVDAYWTHMPPDFRARWVHYKTPQPPWTRSLLARIADSDIGWRLLRFVRDILHI